MTGGLPVIITMNRMFKVPDGRYKPGGVPNLDGLNP
jgi:hypothetical protein